MLPHSLWQSAILMDLTHLAKFLKLLLASLLKFGGREVKGPSLRLMLHSRPLLCGPVFLLYPLFLI
jgi:hypothetical protein